jgi:hypothetical protein
VIADSFLGRNMLCLISLVLLVELLAVVAAEVKDGECVLLFYGPCMVMQWWTAPAGPARRLAILYCKFLFFGYIVLQLQT